MKKTMRGPFGEEILFKNKFPKALLKNKDSYWFVDNVFKKNPVFKGIKNISFLKAGEDLKTLKSFEKNFKDLVSIDANRHTTVYCVGGGSLGDSIGFLCSVYMRGLKFIMLPTTWLASVDSSIGAKTALNGFGFKNIMGTFYPPEKNIYVKDLIKTASVLDAEGEILKTLILNHNQKWAKKIMKSWSLGKFNFLDLKHFVDYKTKIVKKDPKDSTGFRAVLNFGHSLGHALELEKKISHGEAVKQGVLFSICWSEHKGLLSSPKSEVFKEFLEGKLSRISEARLLKALKKDKKSSAKGSLNFIFISEKGPVIEKVLATDVVDEYRRQLCLSQ